MEKLTDWNALWKDLVAVKARTREKFREKETDSWCRKASEFKQSVKRRWETPDSSRDFLLSKMRPEATLLDIGAGTGAWAALIAPKVRKVTAVEPSPSMIEVMEESLEEDGIDNVEIVQGSWPDVSVAKHDFSLCSHAMYGYPDLPSFILKMVDCTTDTCFLLLRSPALNGVRSEAARTIWGQPLDSPNFTIAYNILLQMDICANVLMEDTGFWKARTSASLDEAFQSMKKYLDLDGIDAYDDYLRQLLERRLRLHSGRYIWPQEVRTALVYWSVEKAAATNHRSLP